MKTLSRIFNHFTIIRIGLKYIVKRLLKDDFLAILEGDREVLQHILPPRRDVG